MTIFKPCRAAYFTGFMIIDGEWAVNPEHQNFVRKHHDYPDPSDINRLA